MDTTETAPQPASSTVPDVRRTPISRVRAGDGALERVLPDADGRRVPCAAFNASL